MVNDQPARPANMANIVAINQGKKPYTLETPNVVSIAPDEARKRIEAGAIVLDVRSPDRFGAGHIPGSLTVAMTHSSFEQWVGWILPAEGEVLLAVGAADEAQRAVSKLAFVGLDSRVSNFLEIDAWKSAGLPWATLTSIDVAGLDRRLKAEPLGVLDVRDASEWDGGHIASARHASFKLLPQALAGLGLPKDQELAVTCAGGLRSVIACSILRREGFTKLVNVEGGMGAWKKAGLPTRS